MRPAPVLLSALAALLLLAAVLVTVVVSPALALDSTSVAGEANGILDLQTRPTGLRFRLRIPDYAVDAQGHVDAPLLAARIAEPGKPALPYYSTFVALPPGAELRVTVSELERQVRDEMSIAPAPSLEISGLEPDLLHGSQALDESLLSRRPDTAVYGRDNLYPAQPFEVSEPMQLGNVRVVRLSLYPLRYNPVRGQLSHAIELLVDIDFGLEPARVRSPDNGSPEGQVAGFAVQVLNADQAAGWRQASVASAAPETVLPAGKEVFKIEIDADRVYEVTYNDLQAAGMAVGTIDPRTIEMLYRGEPVAYQFVGNGNSLFESGEKIRFYGWAFNGSRLERQYVTNNVFWLWAGGKASKISTISSQSGTNVTSFTSEVTREPEEIWFPTWTGDWDQFPNEPDAWYWDTLTKTVTTPITRTYAITIPHPDDSASEAVVTAEFSSKWSPVVSSVKQPHRIRLSVNGLSNIASSEWYDKQNVNITGTVPLAALTPGQNQVMVTVATQAQVPAGNAVYLNRITMEYARRLIADGNQLIFSDASGGTRRFTIGGFTTNDLQQLIAWDITNPRIPVAFDPTTLVVSGSGPYSVTFGSQHPAGSRFIASTANILSPKEISKYVPPSLEPASGGADWVAIAYHDFIAETQRLASHRQEPAFGGFKTTVVDIADVINQYGYGLPLPAAIRAYMSHAFTAWPTQPRYLTLVGDATVDPRHLIWQDVQYVPADLAFVDRYQGQIPSDFVYTLVGGNDLLPDIAVGRIPARSIADLSAAVDKIIRYDVNQTAPSDWMRNFTYLADNADSGGNYCLENRDVGAHLPAGLNYVELCLPDNPSNADGDALRSRLFSMINVTGTILLSYRGHGGVNYWAGAPTLMSSDDIGSWNNPQKPMIILTADCLDGFFAYPPKQALGERLIRANNKGSAAYWSASGFGLSYEHTVLEQGFYDAVYDDGLVALGDAANQAKVDFVLAAGHPSILYSFVLLGDPAMQMAQPINLPPVANDDVYASIGTGLRVPAPGVLANDSDPERSALTASLFSSAKHGTIDLAENGAFVYTPTPGFSGVDTFTYRAKDGGGATANGKVSILVSGQTRVYLPVAGISADN